jgi:hypothetical protein
MTELELPIIEPPPGGLARLRERIAADDRSRSRSRSRSRTALRWIPLVTVVAAVIIVLLVRPRSHSTAPVTASTLLPDPAVGVAFYWVAPTTTARTPRSKPSFVDIAAVSIAP